MSRSQPTREEVLRYGRERAQRERRKLVVFRVGEVWYLRTTAPDRFADELYVLEPCGQKEASKAP